MDGRMGAWMDGRMGGRMDGRVEVIELLSQFIRSIAVDRANPLYTYRTYTNSIEWLNFDTWQLRITKGESTKHAIEHLPLSILNIFDDNELLHSLRRRF